MRWDFKIMKVMCALCFFVMASPVWAVVGVAPPEQIVSSPAALDGLGWSVAIHGNIAVLGAQYGDGAAAGSGTAYIYHRNRVTQEWVQQAKLDADDGVAGDLFGHAVAISGKTVVISSLYHAALGNQSGAVYVFEYDAVTKTWVQQTKILASDGRSKDAFGQAVDIQGDRIVISAWHDNNNTAIGFIVGTGSVYVFERDAVTRLWVEKAKLLAEDPQDTHRFGIDVALDRDVIVVGAYWDTHAGLTRAGAAYVFRLDAFTNHWIQEAKLVASDGVAGGFFANDVDVSGNTVVVGAYAHDVASILDAGAAYVFKKNNQTGLWREIDKLYATDPSVDAKFGRSVAIEKDLIAVGAFKDSTNTRRAGSTYLYTRQSTGLWLENLSFIPSDIRADLKFGAPVAISKGTLLVGAGLAHDNGDATPREILPVGQAYFYDVNAYGVNTGRLSVVKQGFQIPVQDPQTHATIATNTNGISFVVWQGKGVHGQLIDPSGALIGSPMVLGDVSSVALHPDVSTDGVNFVVVWHERTRTSNGHDVFALSVNDTAQILMPKTLISAGFIQNTSSDITIHPDVAQAEGDSRFTVVWDASQNGGLKIFSRLFDGNGLPLNDAVQLNVRSNVVDANDKRTYGIPDIDVNASGVAVVAWTAFDVLTNTHSLFYQTFNINDLVWAAGNEEIFVDQSHPHLAQMLPTVSNNQRGDIDIIWLTKDTGFDAVYLKKYSVQSQSWGAAIKLPVGDKVVLTNVNRGVCELLPNGISIVGYTGKNTNGDLDVFLQLIRKNGSQLNNPIQMNSPTDINQSLDQRRPAMSLVEKPTTFDLNITWETINPGGQPDFIHMKQYSILK